MRRDVLPGPRGVRTTLLQVQRAAGNRAAGRWIARARLSGVANPAIMREAAPEPDVPIGLAVNEHVAVGRASTSSIAQQRSPDLLHAPGLGDPVATGEGGRAGAVRQATCPPVPTQLGDIDPDPACPTATHAGTIELGRFSFCPDSDTLASPGDADALKAFVTKNPRATRFLVHGYSSTDGPTDYNFRLACHRANRISEILATSLAEALRGQNVADERIAAEVRGRIETAAPGPTNQFGAAASNRVAIVYGQIPGKTTPAEPGCGDAPRRIGDIQPEVPCDQPSVDLTTKSGESTLTHFHFCLDSDVLAAVGPAAIQTFARSQAATARFVVHGFSSVEGPSADNTRLSCHRALRVARELMNAGVPAEQIEEVSGLGETKAFGPAEFNRVVVVAAQGGEIERPADGPRPAQTPQEKIAIVTEARERLRAGQYNLAADAYIAFWTCGRTRSVREAVDRLRIRIREDQKDELVTAEANGIEEGIGVNTVRVSNTALRSDNPVECVMGRLVDGAFHHAVVGDVELPADLTTPFDPTAKPSDPQASRANMDARHLAGRHLVHLAGLRACTGRLAAPPQVPGKPPLGIDPPLVDDPRKTMDPPACAAVPQPTRLLRPGKGARERRAPDFLVTDRRFEMNSGPLTQLDVVFDKARAPHTTTTESDVIDASASVALVGQPDVFRDYEVGFVQTITDDLFLADYITGHLVKQQLPVPIRAAQARGGVPVPAPWTSLEAVQVPDLNGRLQVSARWRMSTEFATFFAFFRAPQDEHADRLDTWQRHTNVAIWLVARRRGAPLDRFSIVVLDGMTYEVSQNFDVDIRRVRGDLIPEDRPTPGVEHENAVGVGRFRSLETSQEPAGARLAQLGTPVSGDIDLNRHMTTILPPTGPAGAEGMTVEEYRQAAQQILDTLVMFDSPDDMRSETGHTESPRLGFSASPLVVHVFVDRRTGRIGENAARVESAHLGDRVLFHLAKALTLRLQKRDFLKQGRPVVLSAAAMKSLPGSAAIARLSFAIPPLEGETELTSDATVLNNMAEMWDCTALTKSPAFVDFGAREFARTYFRDRDGKLHGDPSDRFVMGDEEIDGAFTTRIPCGPYPAAVKIGTVHTHPIVEDPPRPTPADRQVAKNCGSQHYIISDNAVFRFFPNGEIKRVSVTLPKGVRCHAVSLQEPKPP